MTCRLAFYKKLTAKSLHRESLSVCPTTSRASDAKKMNHAAATRNIRKRICLSCQLRAASRSSAYATIAENAPAVGNIKLPILELRKLRLRQLDYDLRHQLLLTTATDAFKRKFKLKNFEDYWSDERKKRTKNYLQRSAQLKAQLNPTTNEYVNDGSHGSEEEGNWEAIENAARDNINDLVLSQIESCQNADELLRVVVVALDRDVASECIRRHQGNLFRVLRTIWKDIKGRKIGDSKEIEFLKTLNTLLSRLRKANILPNAMLLELALIVSFRQNSMCSVRNLLREIKTKRNDPSDDWKLSNELLEAVTYSGKSNFHHIIPGASRTTHDIAQLITKHNESSQDVYLELFVDPSRPGQLLLWLPVLGLYGNCRAIWARWIEWRKTLPKKHTATGENENCGKQQQIALSVEFVKAFLAQNGVSEAWRVVDDADLSFTSLPIKCQDTLLERLESATKVDADIQNALLKKYERDLTQIEQTLRVEWVEDDGGYHVAHRPNS